MATYVMADIHGEYDKRVLFLRVMRKIAVYMDILRMPRGSDTPLLCSVVSFFYFRTDYCR